MKTITLILIFCATTIAQTVTGQIGVSGQTSTFTISANKVPKITSSAKHPKLTSPATCNAPTDSAGVYQIVAGTFVSCVVTLSVAAPRDGATLTLVSSDTTQFTVPASVITVPANATTADFNITATLKETEGR